MGGHHRDGDNQRGGENILGRIAEGAAIGAVGAVVAEGLREAYRPGYQNPPQGFQVEGRGQNCLPRFEIDRMHEDSRAAAGELLRSGGQDQRLAQAELHHAALIDREFNQQGRYYQEALRELGRDVREESRNQERLAVGQGYNGRPDLQIVPNEQPLYGRPQAPDNYYNQRERRPIYMPQEQWKR
ncbi:MAG: hypothetical protein P4L53_17450 [Candidatus Obscuribacterales bacterium]|nr:hypothetical protein [Candidatus Obscuribacterales bacterium]